MPNADSNTIDKLLQLASDSDSVRFDEHTTGTMLAWGLTKYGVLEAVIEEIESGERVKLTKVKKHPKGMVGQPAFEVTPKIDNKRFYVRMAVFEPTEGQEALLVISVHLDV